MKWIGIPLLWLAALAVAVALLYRLWRGQNVVLRGTWSPQFVRMIVIVLVVLGVGVEKKAAAAPVPDRAAADVPAGRPGDSKWPSAITAEHVTAWLAGHQPESAWIQFKQECIRLGLSGTKMEKEQVERLAAGLKALPAPVSFQRLLLSDLKALGEGQELPPLPPAEALKLLEHLEAGTVYDHWASAYLWRRIAPSAGLDDALALTTFHARLHRHACLTNTLIQAQAQIKPLVMNPRAWMSKAGPPPGHRELQAQAVKATGAMLTVASELYPKSDAGTWNKDGVVVLAVPRNGPGVTLVRAGTRQELKPGETFRFGRLDLIETPDNKPATVEHSWLGSLELPAGRLLSSRSLADLLPDDAKARVKQAVVDAMKGAEEPASKLEKALPLAQLALRESLRKESDLPGAPRLRLILSLFDDAVMPALAPAEVPKGLPNGKDLDLLDRGIAPHKR